MFVVFKIQSVMSACVMFDVVFNALYNHMESNNIQLYLFKLTSGFFFLDCLRFPSNGTKLSRVERILIDKTNDRLIAGAM